MIPTSFATHGSRDASGPPPRTVGEGVRRQYLVDLGLVLVITAVAVFVRRPGLGAQALSFADSWVALVAGLDSPSDIVRVGITAPGFTFLVKGWFMAVGFSPAISQVPAFVFGVAAPALTYVVARKLPAPPLAALAAGLLLAFSPVHAYQSVALKQYTMDAVLVLVLIWLALRVINTTGVVPDGALVVLALAAVAGTIASASVAPVAVCAIAASSFVCWRKGLRKRSVALGLVYVLGAGAWTLVLLQRVPEELTDYWSDEYIASARDLARSATALLNGVGVDGAILVMTISIIAVLAIGWMFYIQPAIALLLAGPLLVALGLSVLGRVPIGTGRTDVYLYPTIALCLSWLIAHGAPRHWQQAVAVAVVVIVAIPFPSVRYEGEPATELVETLIAERQPTEQVIANYGALYTLAVHGPWTDGLIIDVPTVRGFMPRFGDPNVVGIERTPDRAGLIAAVGETVQAQGVWVLFDPRTQPWTADAIAAAMTMAGYELRSTQTNRTSVLQYWERIDNL